MISLYSIPRWGVNHARFLQRYKCCTSTVAVWIYQQPIGSIFTIQNHFAGFLYFWNNIPGDSLGSHNTSRTSRARRCHRRVRRSDELEAFAGLELLDVLWVLFMLFREDEVLKLLGFQAFKEISTWTKNISQTNRNLNRKDHIKSPKTILKRKNNPYTDRSKNQWTTSRNTL